MNPFRSRQRTLSLIGALWDVGAAAFDLLRDGWRRVTRRQHPRPRRRP
jgi:hypothetical protein